MLHGGLAGVAMVDRFALDCADEEELADMVIFDNEQPVAEQALDNGVEWHELLYSDPKGDGPGMAGCCGRLSRRMLGICTMRRQCRACGRRFYLHSPASAGDRLSLLCWTYVYTLCGPRPSLTRMWSRTTLRPLLDLHFIVFSYRFAPLRAAVLGMGEDRQAVESGRVNKPLSHTVKEDENF